MCIHGDKSQPERDWVLTGKDTCKTVLPLPSCRCRRSFSVVFTGHTSGARIVKTLLISIVDVGSSYSFTIA